MLNEFSPLEMSDVIDLCGRAAAARGQALWHNDRVLGVELIDDDVLMGLVQGSKPDPYPVMVLLESSGLFGQCSCPVSVNCKHVAAVLIQFIYQQKNTHSNASINTEVDAIDDTRDSSKQLDNAFDPEKSLEGWLENLITNHQQSDRFEPEIEPGQQLVLYEFPITKPSDKSHLKVRVWQSRVLKRGGYGKEKPFDYEQNYYYRNWLTDLDESIFSLNDQSKNARNSWRNSSAASLDLSGHNGHGLIDKLLQTQRVFLGSQRQRNLTRAVTRSLKIAWDLADGEHYKLRIELFDCNDWQLIPTEPPWYLDVANHRIGMIHGELTARLLQSLMSVPPIPKDQAQSFSNRIAAHLPGLHLPFPVEPNVTVVDEDPLPLLVLKSQDDSPNVDAFYATVMMRYGAWMLPLRGDNAPPSADVENEQGKTVCIRRKPQLEMNIAGQFMRRFPGMRSALAIDPEYFSMADWKPTATTAAGKMRQWQEIVDEIPELEQQSWLVKLLPPFDIRIQQVSEVWAAIEPGEGGWFEMGLRIVHDGQNFDLVPHVADWLSNGAPDQPLLIQSDAGVLGEVPASLLQPIADTLMELFDNPNEARRLRVSAARALTLNALDEQWQTQGIASVWQGGDELFALAEKLKNFSGIKHGKLPKSVKAELRPYQLDGVAWLGFLAQHGFNGILADDMGLGKTLQTLAFLEQQRVAGELHGRVLIVAPTSVLGNWAREAAKFTPKLTTRIWHGGDRHLAPLDDETAKLVITSYALLLRDHDLLIEQGFVYLVLDEAQAIKNSTAKITQAVKAMPIERRLCLTGTPLENHLHELWSQFDFLMPDLLGSRQSFGRFFRTPIENHGDTERLARLHAMIRPFMLRRKKEQVAADLPPKTEIIREVFMEGQQATLYESIRASMEAKVRRMVAQKGLARSHIEMLEALLKLRQTCCHPQLVKLPSARKVTVSAKTELVMLMLIELISEGKKILLFSQFTEMLGLLEVELKRLRISYVKLTGRTRKRDLVIDAFQEGDVPLFLISLKAGGTGLNLTAADTVIHYDPWWNPAVENQASDRAHRIGQDKPVFIYKLITVSTVEEKILAMQEKKQKLADQALAGASAEGLKKLTANDLMQLFSPPEKSVQAE